MDRGAQWATVYAVTESDTTEHTQALFYSCDQVEFIRNGGGKVGMGKEELSLWFSG